MVRITNIELLESEIEGRVVIRYRVLIGPNTYVDATAFNGDKVRVVVMIQPRIQSQTLYGEIHKKIYKRFPSDMQEALSKGAVSLPDGS